MAGTLSNLSKLSIQDGEEANEISPVENSVIIEDADWLEVPEEISFQLCPVWMYLRIRVRIDVNLPLKEGTTITTPHRDIEFSGYLRAEIPDLKPRHFHIGVSSLKTGSLGGASGSRCLPATTTSVTSRPQAFRKHFGPLNMSSGSKQGGPVDMGVDKRWMLDPVSNEANGHKRSKPTLVDDFGPDVYSTLVAGQKSQFAMSELSSSPLFIFGNGATLEAKSVRKWRKMARVLSKRETHRRNESWHLLRTLNVKSSLPWLCASDFNEILCSDEKVDGAIDPSLQMDEFREHKLNAKSKEYDAVYKEGTDDTLFNQCKSELDDLIKQEEVMWRERSKAFWLREGDRNTGYFHSVATTRRRRNNISSIEDAGVDWKTSDADIEKANMVPDPDGFSPSFFQKCWHIVGTDVVRFELDFLNNGVDLPDVNHTNIVLIPKVDNPGTMRDYRPITLCNVIFKIVSKAIANRLKLVLPSVIGESQSPREEESSRRRRDKRETLIIILL
ncbi:reverse transcriptase [Corchorus capsularis]|uniref:Reverse transcriptase n=1 Tax=Corchorus capsularis TaxID=210143 RepID=A0A1R3KWQ9_COCAP|nr:reverse transcriptase [Corchorus capsularis]